jgi:hypothetical protein
MAKATSSISQFPTIHITTAAHVLAMLRARNAVKDQIRKQGLKLTHFSAREITGWAHVFLGDHHETLIPDAIGSSRNDTKGRNGQARSAFQLLRLCRC